ncbi:MAG: NlpC/P60 family protein, partial [Mycobacteriales bacterium]
AAAGVQQGTAPSQAAATAIHWAFQEIGVPYSWGGGDDNGPTRGFAQGANTVGFDCSGLMLFVYHKAGVQLDHYTGSQWNVGPRFRSMSDVEPGDLLFFAYDPNDEQTIHHVALYIGNGKMIEAPYTGEVVRVSSAYRSDFIGATRPWA